jgi:hypothetical protein
MKKIVLTNGLISGLIVSVIMAASMIICYKNPELLMGNGSMVVGYLSMLLAFSLIYVGARTYRDTHNHGVIGFGKAFSIGLFIALIASTIYVIVWAITYNFFIPDFMEHYSAAIIKHAEATGSDNVQQKAAEMATYAEMYKNPLYFTLITYAEILPVGIIVSIIAAFIVRRKALQVVA